jgi:hypothetical protein
MAGRCYVPVPPDLALGVPKRMSLKFKSPMPKIPPIFPFSPEKGIEFGAGAVCGLANTHVASKVMWIYDEIIMERLGKTAGKGYWKRQKIEIKKFEQIFTCSFEVFTRAKIGHAVMLSNEKDPACPDLVFSAIVPRILCK